MKQLLLFSATFLVLASCNNNETKEAKNADTTTIVAPAHEAAPVPDMHNAENALDYEGTYSGTVPCASCEGIVTTATLNKDKTFTLKEEYKGGKEPGTFDAKGTYEVKGNIATLKFTGKDADRTLKFHVGENQLFMLDANDKIIEGELAKNYILTKK